MHKYDRDFVVSTLSILQHQNRHLRSAVNNMHEAMHDMLDDMHLRIEELEEFLYSLMDEQDWQDRDQDIQDAWTMGRNFAESEWENDKIVYDSSRKKECMCDDCWDVPADKYEHRMD